MVASEDYFLNCDASVVCLVRPCALAVSATDDRRRLGRQPLEVSSLLVRKARH